MTPIDRACLEWAYRIGLGFCAEDEVIVLRGGEIVTRHGIEPLDPSGSPTAAVIATLAGMMKLHLDGISFGKLRDDLLRSGVGEQFANRVYDHLVDVSVAEWDRLRARVRWYGDDNGAPIFASTSLSGDT
ncbi:MAG: hypothetical protein LCH92_12475 [Proteobacteria bacterium]|nr:hypothetical protein [Pseudomonadota bacterium]